MSLASGALVEMCPSSFICKGRPSACVVGTIGRTTSDAYHVFSLGPPLSSHLATPTQPLHIPLSPPRMAADTPVRTPPYVRHPVQHPARLPYDIFALILEHFIPQAGANKKREHSARFASFATVSTEWYTFVSPRLYADIVFSDAFSSVSQRRLCTTLQSNPKLAACVRSCWVTLGSNNHYDGISLFELPAFAEAVSNMHNLEMLQLRSIDITAPFLHSLGQRRTLKTLSLIQCIFSMTPIEQEEIIIGFRLRKFTMHGSPPLAYERIISKLFNTDHLEHLSIDSQVTEIGLRALHGHYLANIRYLYAEPSREDTELFCATLARCHKLVRLGFSHSSKSLPLKEEPFVEVGALPAMGHLTHWTGPSLLVSYFLRNGDHRLRHIALDQTISSDGDRDIPFVELLRPRNLSVPPEVESLRISAIQSLVSQPSTLRTLDVVLASSHSVKEVMANCQVHLTDLRIKCTDPAGHTTGLEGATSTLSSLTNLKEIHISAPPGFGEPDIERDLRRQHEIVNKWSRIGSIERVAFSAWLRWHRASQGDWTPLVTANDIARNKMKRWRRRKFQVMDWDNRLGDALGTQFECAPVAPDRVNDSAVTPPPPLPVTRAS